MGNQQAKKGDQAESGKCIIVFVCNIMKCSVLVIYCYLNNGSFKIGPNLRPVLCITLGCSDSIR